MNCWILFDGIESLAVILNILTTSNMSKREKLSLLYVYDIVSAYIFLLIFRLWLLWFVLIFPDPEIGYGVKGFCIGLFAIYIIVCCLRISNIDSRQKELRKENKLNLYKIKKKYYERKTRRTTI